MLRHLRDLCPILVAAIPAALFAQIQSAPPPPDGHRVRVLDHATGRPVPGAIVGVVELSRLDSDVRARLVASNGTDFVDEEPVLEGASRLYHADAEGRVRIPRSDSPHCLIVRDGERAGVQRITPLDEGPTTIVELTQRRRRDVRVEVVDAAGLALAGVPVAIVEKGSTPIDAGDDSNRKTATHTRERARASTDEHGTAMIALGASSQEVDAAPGRGLSTSATFAFPHDPRSAVPIDVEALGAAAIELVAPATGRLDIEVIGPDGKPSSEASSVLLVTSIARAELSANERVIDERRIDLVGGRARVDRVGLALRFHAFARWQGHDGRSAEIAGPTRAGESATLRLELARVMPIAAVRVLDPDGAPYAAQTLDARVFVAVLRPELLTSHQVETDGEGRCWVALGDAALEKVQRRVFALVARDARLEAQFDLTQPVPVGVHDLGDAKLEAPWERAVPLLVGGRVVDEEGAPVEGAEVVLVRARTGVSGSRPSFVQEAPAVVTGAEGTFDFRGWFEPGELALQATKRGFLRLDAVSFHRKASDIVVTLARCAALEGDVLVDPGLPVEQLSIASRRAGEPAVATTRYPVLRDGSFWIGEVARGRVGVLVLLAGSDVPIAVAGEVELRGGDVSRVPALDLRGKVRVLDFHVVDPEGKPVHGVRVDVSSSETDDDAKPETLASASFSNDHVRLLVPKGAIDVTLRADGFRTLVLRDIETIDEAVLHRFLPVRLRLAAPPTAVPGRARLAPIVRSGSGDAIVLTAQSHFHGFDERGEILLEISRPGRYSVTYEVLPKKTRADALPVKVAPDPPHSIEVLESDDEQVFVLDLPETEIEEALAKAR